MALPSRVDSGIILSQIGSVHMDGGNGHTLCAKPIPAVGTVRVSDQAVLIGRLSKCHTCWKKRWSE